MATASPIALSAPHGATLYAGVYQAGMFGALQLADVAGSGALGVQTSDLSGTVLADNVLASGTLVGAYVPAWLSATSVGQWAAISGTAVPQELKDFCGVGLRDELGVVQLFSGASGGHGGNLTNNRVMTIDLLSDSPTWVQQLAASDASAWPSNGSGGPRFVDGRPAPRHTYNGAIWVPERSGYAIQGRFFGSGAVDYDCHDVFLPGSTAWQALSTGRAASSSLEAYDPSTGIYYAGVGQKWTASTDTWSGWTLSGTGTVGRLGLAFDTTRGQLFHLSTGDGWSSADSTINCCKITTAGVKTAITFNASAAWTQFQANAASFLGATTVYDKDLDRFYFYQGSGTVIYVITPNSGTTWDMAVLPVTGVTPPTGSDFGKFKYSSRLKCLLFTPANPTAGYNVHFLRTQ